jgi:hypothetical protein
MNPNIQQQSLDTSALILGALTAGGGITGYARTGSVPSIAAGVTVGSLVCHQFHRSPSDPSSLSQTTPPTNFQLHKQVPNVLPVYTRWPAHPLARPIRCRTRAPGLYYPRWKLDPPCGEDTEASPGWIECFGALWAVGFWDGVPEGNGEGLSHENDGMLWQLRAWR